MTTSLLSIGIFIAMPPVRLGSASKPRSFAIRIICCCVVSMLTLYIIGNPCQQIKRKLLIFHKLLCGKDLRKLGAAPLVLSCCAAKTYAIFFYRFCSSVVISQFLLLVFQIVLVCWPIYRAQRLLTLYKS